jgi:hypothetical protein
VRKRHEMPLKPCQFSFWVEGGAQPVEAGRPIKVTAKVVLAAPDQLDRATWKSGGNRRGLDEEVIIEPPAEPTPHPSNVKKDFLRPQP